MDRPESPNYRGSLTDVLAHFGVKGMKWGVRRERKFHATASEDAKKARESKKVVKKHGTAALSNKDLKDLVTRLNLEQQYGNLTATSGAIKRIENGQKNARILINTGKTIKEIVDIAAPVAKVMAEASASKNPKASQARKHAKAYRVKVPQASIQTARKAITSG